MDINWPGEKLLIKLLDTLKEGVGASFRPWQIKREEAARIESRRRERLLLETTEREANSIRSGEKILDSNWRLIENSNASLLPQNIEVQTSPTQTMFSQMSLEHQSRHVRRGVNLRKIALFAEEEAEHLESNDKVSEEPVDPDWFARWRGYAEDVSREEMQRLWGRLLVGEVRVPGTYSIHTVEFLSRMSRADAELIAKLAQFSLGQHIFSQTSTTMENCGINFDDLIYLSDINILNGVVGIGGLAWKLPLNESGGQRYIVIPNNNFGLAVFAASETPSQLNLPVYTVSRVGQELLSLAQIQGNLDYLREIRDFLFKQGFTKAQLGRFLPQERQVTDLFDF